MKKKSKWKSWLQYGLTLGAAVGSALIIRTLFLSAYRIPTDSMIPTLKPGDYIFADKTVAGWRWTSKSSNWVVQPEKIHAGELVILRSPSTNLMVVRRVVALAGESVALNKDSIIVAGKAVAHQALGAHLYTEDLGSSSYTIFMENPNSYKKLGDAQVQPDTIFVLSDNRENLDDSRTWGGVPAAAVVGKPWLLWLSLEYNPSGHGWPSIRWERLFQLIH